MGTFPFFIGIFPFLWEFSHIHGNLKKACSLDKRLCVQQ